MNKQRRARLAQAKNALNEALAIVSKALANNAEPDTDKLNDLLDTAGSIVTEVLDDEQEAFDNMPAGLQDSLRGMDMSAAIDSLTDATEALDARPEDLDELQDRIYDAIGAVEDAAL